MTTPPTIPEEALLHHSRFIQALAASVSAGTDIDVEDIVQETYLAIARRRPSDVERLRPWLRRVVRGLAVRSRSKRHRVAEIERHAPLPHPEPDPAQQADQQETIRQVIQEVLRLPEHYRTTLLLRHYHGLSHREIAERQGIALETVTTRLRRGMEQLRQRLRGLQVTEASLHRWWSAWPALVVLAAIGSMWWWALRPAKPPLPRLAQSIQFHFDGQFTELDAAGEPKPSSERLETMWSVNIEDRVQWSPTLGDYELVRRYLDGIFRTRTVADFSTPISRTAEGGQETALAIAERTMPHATSRAARPSLDLETLFLPKAVVGDSWQVPVGHLARILAPDDAGLEAGRISRAELAVANPGQWLSHHSPGSCVIDVREIREVEGETMVICDVRVELMETRTKTNTEEQPREGSRSIDRPEVTIRATLQGELWWSEADSRGRFLGLAGPARLTIPAPTDAAGNEEDSPAESQFDGRVHWMIHVTPTGP